MFSNYCIEVLKSHNSRIKVWLYNIMLCFFSVWVCKILCWEDNVHGLVSNNFENTIQTSWSGAIKYISAETTTTSSLSSTTACQLPSTANAVICPYHSTIPFHCYSIMRYFFQKKPSSTNSNHSTIEKISNNNRDLRKPCVSVAYSTTCVRPGSCAKCRYVRY